MLHFEPVHVLRLQRAEGNLLVSTQKVKPDQTTDKGLYPKQGEPQSKYNPWDGKSGG